MNTVGECLPANVKCAVEDCGFVEIKEILASNLKAVMNFKVDFLMPGIDFVPFGLEAFGLDHLLETVGPLLLEAGERGDQRELLQLLPGLGIVRDHELLGFLHLEIGKYLFIGFFHLGLPFYRNNCVCKVFYLKQKTMCFAKRAFVVA